VLIDFLINRARSFIFSTAPVPAAAAAATAALKLIDAVEGAKRTAHLWSLVAKLQLAFNSRQSAIIPIIIGDETKAVTASAKLRERDFFVPAIRYPTVARHAARLRVTLTAAHTGNDITQLIRALMTLDMGLRTLDH
jgi:7-keto-8-aminopelargonate synthetase-like enzyme